MKTGLYMALLWLFCAVSSFAQVNAGMARGVVRDSTHNFAMPAATISVYYAVSGALVSYQLANNFGRFQFNNLPVGIRLRVVTSNVGYLSTVREFTIPADTANIDLQTFNMTRQPLSLKEVTIEGTPPPVQMRGDTLEFNADAFKLDSNAVVGDMLKKLPGITVWNDGVITFNGKKINRLLVDGKDFFGIDGKTALQNLAKDAVKKVQVYENKTIPDPIDRQTDMNIVLKKDKKDGYFGKISGSTGTTDRYDANGMFSYFSPKNQLSVVSAINNVNKTADNVNTLVQINSFKGEGLSNDYHSDFTKAGATVFKAAGFTALHDFSTSKENKIDTNHLKVDFFLTSDHADINQLLRTKISLTDDHELNQTIVNTTRANREGQIFSAEYEKKFDHLRLKAGYDFLHQTSGSRHIMNIASEGDAVSQTNDEQQYTNSSNIHSGSIQLKSDRYKDYVTFKNKSADMNLDYWFNINSYHDNQHRITDFTSSDTVAEKHFNRQYATKGIAATHNISHSFNNLLNNPELQMAVKNLLIYSHKNETDDVNDFSAAAEKFIPNPNLSTALTTNITDYRPGLDVTRYFIHQLSNRYRKTWRLGLFAQGQLYHFENTSQQVFQNLHRSYFYFVPSANIGYSNNQIGRYREDFMLKYNTGVTYPTLQQLAPLVDDANVTALVYGNTLLQPAYSHDVTFTYNFSRAAAGNPFIAEVLADIGVTEHYISDSTIFDELGRSIRYPVNVSGEHHYTISGKIQQALKYDEHQLQFSGRAKFNSSEHLSGLNNTYYETQLYAWSANADVTYNYKDFSAQLGETFYNNKNTRQGLDTYIFRYWKTYGYLSLMLNKGLFVNSRVDFTKSIATNIPNIYYTIWNMDLGYRFLKGNNAEVKFSALDILHQNRNVINTISNNSITTGTSNVLQQYFMITLAYYPRKFGLRKKDDHAL